MIKFAVAGSLNYKDKIDYLVSHGYTPELIIGSENISNFLEVIKEKKIELLVCFAYPHILKTDEIELLLRVV